MDATPDDDAQLVRAAPAMRASDADRAAAADRLHVALVEGRLSMSETDERLAAVYAARYQLDLPILVADLPVPEAGHPVGGWPGVWQAIIDQVWMSSARARGAPPDQADQRQQRAVAALLIVAAVWMAVCLLVGISVGMHA